VKKLSPILICIILTIIFSIPSLIKVPMMMPFLDAEVRAKAPQAIEKLRKEGIWVVNAELIKITKEQDKTCFHFSHEYKGKDSRFRIPDSEQLTSCI
jgi:hypothetical protein